MARPRKATVDYFPHVCNHGQTMFIVEQRFGNDGYSFWFKLLETLGTSEGHYIDLGNPTVWEFLQAKTRLDESFCTQILDLLARLGAIDGELWESAKVVWSQRFVDGIADVYRNRRAETPLRPSFYCKKPGSAGVSTPQKPQSKVKDSKGNHSSTPTPPAAAEVIAFWEQNMPGTLGKYTADRLAAWVEDDGMESALVIYAIEKAIAANVKRLDYVEAILTSWSADGIKTLAAAKAQPKHRTTDTPTEYRPLKVHR